MPICYQINLQQSFGGGEVYTRFFTEAMREMGWDCEFFVARGARFWKSMGLAASQFHEVSSEAEIRRWHIQAGSLIITHTALGPDFASELARNHVLVGFVHMPLFERNPAGLQCYTRLFGVSRHVIESARLRGLSNMYPEPMYGAADLSLRPGGEHGKLRAGPLFDWDQRKWRDRVLGWIAPLAAGLTERPCFLRRPGLTLGIVSRITPIKQFPALFSILAPILSRYPEVNLEIFGSGGYASVRDLRRALKPMRGQVRYWGMQGDVGLVYSQLDYVLSGLPEKEALGLNLIEAQSCGTPVLAVNAPPFTETVRDGESGFLFEDPRGDSGLGFERLVQRLLAGQPRPDPRLAVNHAHQFSKDALKGRMRLALASLPAIG